MDSLGRIFVSLTVLVTTIASADVKIIAIPTTNALTLSATLTIPSTTRPAAGYPALVLIQGSGPTDRDGNNRLVASVKIDLLKQLAEALANEGIATLRYDKRGMDANRAQMPATQAGMAAFFDWDRFADDAVAAYEFLDAQPNIDPARVGFLGHSEGGSLALVAADRLKSGHHPPATLILIGTMGRTEDKVITDQLKRIMAGQKATDDQQKIILEANDRITAEIKRTGQVPADVPAGLKALYPSYLGPFLKGSLSVDDAALAAAYPGPVLVINGELDAQVSPTLDGGALDAILKTRHADDHRFVIISGASHNLKHVENATDPGLAGPVDPKAVDSIQVWCREKLAVSSR